MPLVGLMKYGKAVGPDLRTRVVDSWKDHAELFQEAPWLWSQALACTKGRASRVSCK